MLKLKETENIELKRELIAFVNTYGGEIYIGIDNDGKFSKKAKGEI